MSAAGKNCRPTDETTIEPPDSPIYTIGESSAGRASDRNKSRLMKIGFVSVRPEGACHQRRRVPPRELSIDLVANERLGRVTGRAEAS
jgi:hypothetical protein